MRALIGYPGQENRLGDPDATPPYVANGMLKVVTDGGPIFRPTQSNTTSVGGAGRRSGARCDEMRAAPKRRLRER